MSETNEPDLSPVSNSGDDSTSVHRQSIEGIFVEALGKPSPEERRAFLDTACDGNPETRRRVEALLAAYDDAGSFLQHAAGDWKNPPQLAGAATVDPHGIPIGLLQPSDKPGCLGTIGPYEVQQFLGRGGMGIVLRALDPQLNRVVAIKVLAPELAVDVSSRRRFLREARAAAAVSHPHVVTIHAVAVDDDRLPYLVMECIVGRTLQQKIDQNGSLKLKEILRIGTQIAEGLAAAHKHGLVHRDIKPANVLLENGVERVKITDFGLARSVEDAAITRTGEVSGTPQYMSPEQALGQHVDHRSDLFSLGCVLYAMCAGRPPFRGDNVAVVVKRICDESPRPIGDFNSEIPGWLIQTIERLLAKDPAQRIQSAAEVAEVLSGQLAHAQQPQGTPLPPPPARRVIPNRLKDRLAPYLPGAASPAKPVSTAVLVCAFAAAAVMLGRLKPASSFAGSMFLMLVAIGSAVFIFKRGSAAGWHPFRSTIWTLAVIAACIAGSAFGTQLHIHQHGDAQFGDLQLYLLGLGFLFYVIVYRQGLVYATGGVTGPVAGTAAPPVAQPAATSADPAHAAASRPWQMAGWLTVALLSLLLLIPCGLGLAIVFPMLARDAAEAERGTLTIEYDNNKAPIQEIRLRGGNLPGERAYSVDSMPFRIRLAPGNYTLTATEILYEATGQRVATVQPVTFSILKQKDTRLNLAASGVN